MTTSFNMTRNQIIHKAYRKAGIVGEGEQVSEEQLHEAADDLNLIIKNLEKHRRKIWSVEQLTQTLNAASRVTYLAKYYACNFTHTSTATETPDTSGYWDEIELAEADTIPDDWVDATAYTGSSFDVPAGTTAIEQAIVYRPNAPHIQHPIYLLNRFDDLRVPNKTAVGTPAELYFRRYPLPGRVFIYPSPLEEFTLVYSRVKLLDDLTSPGGFPDIPVTLIAFLIYELAAEIAEEYDREEQKIHRLRNKAQAELALAIRNQKEYQDDPLIGSAY